MAINELPRVQRPSRAFFITVAAAFPLIVVAGFARTYYLKAFFDAPPVPSMLVHAHGILMSSWVLLFAVQVWFISSRRIKLHQRLGYAGVALGLLLIPVGLMTAVAAAKYGSSSTPPGFPPLAFMAVPFFDIVVFALLFGAAVYYRKRPANHKRLMLLTVLNFLPPAIGRIPLAFVAAGGPLVFFGVPDLLALIFLIVDTWRHGKLNKVFLAGTIVLIVSHPMRIVLSGTDAWMSFASWITS